MSLYGIMRTSASGMSAQADRLGTVADNIANAATTGYKRAFTEFSTLVLESGVSSYESGAVEPHVRYAINEQGSFSYTNSVTDLAIKGEGFFVVANTDGQTFLTRAGAFVLDGTGDLVNVAGYTLMAYPITGGTPSVVANGTAGLERVNIGALALEASPSIAGRMFVNMPANADFVAAADLPSANAATAQFTAKTSLVAYDNIGNEITLDVYSTKTAANTWEVTVFDQAAAAAGGGFPYTSAALTTSTLTFDPANGHLAGASPTSISIPVPNGNTLVLNMDQTTQLAADYAILDAQVDGNAASSVDRIEITDDGLIYSIYTNGARLVNYQIPLANVPSPNNMLPLAGNVYKPTSASGDLLVGFASSNGFGSLVSGALEKSTVDLASELTNMIEAERNYTANSKVFQTGADLMEVLVNLKR